LTLQKKYEYAWWFRIDGYLEKDYGIYLSPTTIKKLWRSIVVCAWRHNAPLQRLNHEISAKDKLAR
jgi:hypothetical protein